ncbi:type IV pilus assembly protein PilM [Vibrio astriarenae]|uniref:Type IV pilus assembly protein PilM n=1 Tax=Vibrio astriarenae TaxID=1481923 RepID=A0A7Z2T4T8_9VIBR|nr:type IV pilus assembly protein PilM [Vibrio astriarenae]QIA64409.1 type IV pilus assembly protein PilM [Vibrio astriarenae]
MGMSLITGIDIGRYSIKAVVVKPEKQHFTIVAFHELPVSDAVFSDNHTLNYQDSVKKLKDLKKMLPWMSHEAAMAIPDSTVISKVLQIDASTDDAEQEFAIHQAFSYQSPFSIEELRLDYVAASTTGPSSTKAFQVFAAKREVIESRQRAAIKAGFKPRVMDTQAHALARVYQQAAEKTHKSGWLLVDVGHVQTTLCLVGEAVVHKEFAFGTHSALSQEQAVTGDDGFVRQLSERLRRQIQMLPMASGQSIQGIWLTGGGAYLAMIEEHLSNALGLPCEKLAPLSLASVKPKLCEQAMQGQHQYAVALGAALGAYEWESQHYAT